MGLRLVCHWSKRLRHQPTIWRLVKNRDYKLYGNDKGYLSGIILEHSGAGAGLDVPGADAPLGEQQTGRVREAAKKEVPPLVGRPLRVGGGKGRATKVKEQFLKL